MSIRSKIGANDLRLRFDITYKIGKQEKYRNKMIL